MRTLKNSRGFTLPEMIVYVALMALLLVGVVDGVNLMLHAYRSAGSGEEVASTAQAALSRLEYETRRASAVATSSVLGTDPSDLMLSTTDASGSPETLEFSAANRMLYMTVNGDVPAPLLPADVSLESFVATATTTPHAQAVTFTISMRGGIAPNTTTFRDSAVLRGSYH